MAPSLQRLDQIHPPDLYDDTLSAAAVAASEGTAQDLATHAFAILSQLKRILRGDGPGNWFDDPAVLGPVSTDASLAALAARARLEDKNILTYRLQLTDLAVPSGQNWVAFTAGGTLPAANIAIADSSQGAVVSQLATAVGVHSLEINAGLNALQPKNLVRVYDGTTGEVLQSEGRVVSALLQVGDNATDGNPFGTSGDDQAQLSFVRPNAAYTTFEAVPAADIENTVVVYGYTIRDDLQDTPEESFRADTLAGGGFAHPHTFGAGCDASLVVGEWVYISGPSVAGVYQVARVDISDYAKLPAVGVVAQKPTSTTCFVQWGGEIRGLGTLDPRRIYFLQPDAMIGLNAPTTAGQFIQRVGVALDASVLLINPNLHLVRRS